MQNHGHFLSIQTKTRCTLNTLKQCLAHSKQFILIVTRVGSPDEGRKMGVEHGNKRKQVKTRKEKPKLLYG